MARLERATHRRGLAIVETALILPLLMVLTLGILEFGWCFIKLQQINIAAREGARAGARSGGTNAQVDAAVADFMTRANMGGSSYSVATVPADVDSAARGSTIRVRVAVTYANNVDLIGSFVGHYLVPNSISSEYRIMKE
jgi:Flp pilus assembly protein TadG